MENSNKLSEISDIELVKLSFLYDKQIQEVDNQINHQKEIYESLIKKVKEINNKSLAKDS